MMREWSRESGERTSISDHSRKKDQVASSARESDTAQASSWVRAGQERGKDNSSGFGGEKHKVLAQADRAIRWFSNFQENEHYSLLLDENERQYCESQHEKLEDIHRVYMASLDGRDFDNFKKAVTGFEALRDRVEQVPAVRKKAANSGLMDINKEDLHYIILKENKNFTDQIEEWKRPDKRAVSGRSYHPVEVELRGKILDLVKSDFKTFASAMSTHDIDTAYTMLERMQRAPFALSGLGVRNFGEVLGKIQFECQPIIVEEEE